MKNKLIFKQTKTREEQAYGLYELALETHANTEKLVKEQNYIDVYAGIELMDLLVNNIRVLTGMSEEEVRNTIKKEYNEQEKEKQVKES